MPELVRSRWRRVGTGRTPLTWEHPSQDLEGEVLFDRRDHDLMVSAGPRSCSRGGQPEIGDAAGHQHILTRADGPHPALACAEVEAGPKNPA